MLCFATLQFLLNHAKGMPTCSDNSLVGVNTTISGCPLLVFPSFLSMNGQFENKYERMTLTQLKVSTLESWQHECCCFSGSCLCRCNYLDDTCGKEGEQTLTLSPFRALLMICFWISVGSL